MNRAILLCLFYFINAAAVSCQEVQFTKRATQVDDTSHQVVECNLTAERTIRQHNQLVDSSSQSLKRRQVRSLTILEINEGIPVRGRLTYGDSSTQIRGDNNQSMEVIQPVANKTYLVTQQGTQILFTDAHENAVTKEEEEVLRIHMDAFGKPNPLSQFLHGKSISLGQSIVVPDEVARELLGLTGNSGKTDKLTLKLVKIQEMKGAICGIFETLLRTSNQESSMSLLMKGELIVETNSCQCSCCERAISFFASDRRF